MPKGEHLAEMNHRQKGVFKDLSTVFWSKVLKTKGCWLWLASCHDFGYGHLRHGGKDLKAHRVAWELTNGPIPDGMQVLHSCDNPVCVNPSHLFLGTQQVNITDMMQKGRYRRHAALGENNGSAKLREPQVLEILRSTDETSRVLALKYAVSPSLIKQIRRREIWKSLKI
ncbi:hypothetical protein ES703_101582 [subsurface metagenome]